MRKFPFFMATTISAVFSLALIACGDSGSSSTNPDAPDKVASKTDLGEFPSKKALPECLDAEAINELMEYEVVSSLKSDEADCSENSDPVIMDNSVYTCEKKERVIEYSYAIFGETAQVGETIFKCQKGSWETQEKEDSSDSKSNEACKNGEKKKGKVCFAGKWIDESELNDEKDSDLENEDKDEDNEDDENVKNKDEDDEDEENEDENVTSSSSKNKNSSSSSAAKADKAKSSSSATKKEETKESSASKSDKEESSDEPKKIEFVDGIIWQPSYGNRANTGFFETSEDTFLSECSEEDKLCGGFWFKYLDNIDGGTSQALGTFTNSSLELIFTLKYNDWHLEGTGKSSYYAPDPYPYAGFGFSWADNMETVDISNLGTETDKGLCITYSSIENVKLVLVSTSTATDDAHYKVVLPITSGTAKTLNIPFTSFTQPTWKSYSVGMSTALKNAESLQIQYTNDESHVTSYCSSLYECKDMAEYYGISNINIFEIGTYGSCGKSSSIL